MTNLEEYNIKKLRKKRFHLHIDFDALNRVFFVPDPWGDIAITNSNLENCNMAYTDQFLIFPFRKRDR